ncbi:HEPN domain-containing protein [Citricoccus alkalitolerans]|uniref:HEPN domain-containing protein n=1 Tax=Citricoccus alkalitolerans TaxID=246603 RepID=A0ABV8XW59_9MICC
MDLVDVSITYWSAEHGRINAGSATVGVPSGSQGFGWNFGGDPRDEEQAANQSVVPTYTRVTAQVGALDAVAGASPFSGWTFPKDSEARHLAGEWTVSGNPESSQEWRDDDVTVLLEYVAGVSIGNPYAFRFVVSPVVRIESREALSVREWVDRWIVPLRRIASIATGDAQPLTYLAVHPTSGDVRGTRKHRGRQVYGSGITQKPYQSDQTSVRKASTSVHIAVDGLSLLDMIRRWQKLEDDHHPLIETYGAMLSATDEHPRSRFLLLIQALEGLHGHETAAAYAERKERHTEERKALIEALKGADTLDSRQLKFVKRNLAKQPLRGLDEALRHLLGRLPVDLTPRLSDCNLLAEYLSEAQGPEIQRVAYALSRVRNDLAHGNKGFDAYDLNEAVRVLERIVRAQALRLLGCPDSVLERVCDLDR